MNFGKDTKTKFKYDFPSGMMRLGLTSPIVDANIDYHVVASPARIGSISSGSEKLSLSMNKNLDFLKASTNFRYGLLEESMNYGVTKQLVQYGGSSGGGSLSAQVDQRHGLKDTSRDETLVRLNFGTSF
jgi:hypothetical protein